MKETKTWRRLFIGLLGLQAVIEFALGIALLFFFPATVESGFGVAYTSDLDVLGIALGLYLLRLTALLVLSIFWTVKGNYSGITIGVIAGIFLFFFGMVTFLQLGTTDGLYADSMRGLLTIALAYMANKELKNQKQHA
jgi:hypothetical protein